MPKKELFNKICKDIRSIKIQGATNIAKKAFYASKLFPGKKYKQKLISLRPTEPMLFNVLNLLDKLSYNDLVKLLESNQKEINKNLLKIIKRNPIIFTHCHSSNVISALIYAKKKHKRFQVYNSETRPLFQGRKTAKELNNNHINVTMFIDSEIGTLLDDKKIDLVLLGSDAILDNGVINKVGSSMFAEVAYFNKVPVYIIADSLKYSKTKINIEERSPKEVWKNNDIKIKNPAFDFVKKKYITAIISEFGVLKYDEFLKIVKKRKLF